MPLKLADKISLTIHDIAFGGEGVGRVDDFVVFVPFVIVGETVEVEITEVKKNFARAKLLRVEKSSLERVTPECRYFGACGGCQYQHIAYATQLRLKHKQISDLFERVGKIPADKIAPVIPSPQPYGYRNRIMIRSQWNGPAKKLVIGFIRADNNFVEDIEECKIAEPAISEQIKNVRANPPPKGGIKIVLRIPPENWDVPPDSFFQNNFFLLPKLVETVRGFLVEQASSLSSSSSEHTGRMPVPLKRHLVDLYCGVGFFGIETADLVESFVGVEYDQLAITAARKNAASRKINNGEFVSAKVEEVLPELLKKFSPEKTSVILDPPRKGCLPETLRLLRETRPAQVIYVSCHPATMARDLNILCADGVFELARVQPLDMFPQTQHVECVADLRAGQALPNRAI
ncbi:MAG TPA: class I SAM-dependent RNA methyltransferase [Verrucomicrobiae bacterium]|jgi:tRNA/tmRNA/rRNA uracil-C5-methylase (TrmA/RlmC/RlmD family)